MRTGLKVIALGLLLGAFAATVGAQQPIVRIKPKYPDAAVEARITGYVTAEFTIGETGVVRDLVVVDSSAKIFEDAAIAALQRWRYAQDPTVVGIRVQQTIEFTVADLELELANRDQRSSPP